MNENNNVKTNETEFYTIDILHILKSLWHRAWIIVFTGILIAAIGFSFSAFCIAPKYSSSIMLYVNNSSFSLGNTNFSISSSEISAAQSLVKTYIVMLKNRTTYEQVIEKADLNYTYEELYGMVQATSVNDTEVLQVTVVSEDPYEATTIVNCIAEVLPLRIAEIIEGASMEVVDSGVVNTNKISPSITKYTALGFIIGALLSTLCLVILALLDDTVHDEDYVLKTYEYPVLAKVPDLLNTGTKPYNYYYKNDGTNGKKKGSNK